MAGLVDYNFTGNSNYTLDPTGVYAAGQTFTGNGSSLSSVVFKINKAGTPTGNVVAKLYAHSGTYGTSGVPTGSPLATSSSVSASSIGTSSGFVFFNFPSSYTLTNGTKYCISIDVSGTSGGTFIVKQSTTSVHSGNRFNWDYLFTGTWAALDTADLVFSVYNSSTGQRYATATGNWSGAIWSPISGGPAGSAATPTISDNVYIAANYTVTLTADADCRYLFHSNGTLTCSSFNMHIVYMYSDENSSTAKTLNMGSGTWTIDYSGMGYSFWIRNLATVLNSQSSTLILNGADDNGYPLAIGNKALNDVIINLTGSGSNPTNITGSPTFRLLDIRSANSSAHTVRFDIDASSGGTATVDKLIAFGSSSSNKLTLAGKTGGTAGFSIFNFSQYGTSYGQYVNLSNLSPNTQGPTSIPYYIGTSSTKDSNSDNWLLQDPPKISTLLDNFDTLDSNVWETRTSGTGSIAVSSGKLNMGWAGGSSSSVELVSKDTFDLINEITYVKIDSNQLGLAVGVVPVYSGATTGIGAATEITASQRYYRISATSGGILTIDKFDTSWTNLTTQTVSPEQLRSVRLSISGSRNTLDGTVVIDSVGVPNISVPAVTTNPATSITNTTATLNGEVNYDGSKTITERGFVYSTSPNPTTTDTKTTVSGTTGSFSKSVTGLTAKTVYHYRGYAINSEGTGYGSDVSFTTLGKPTADFTASPTTGKRPVSVTFTDTSTFSPTSWSWNFGDSGTSTLQNPTHSYENAGTYTVSLTATNSYGSDTITKTGIITISPETYSRSVSGTLKLGGSLTRLLTANRLISGSLLFGGSVTQVILTQAEALQDKRYLYKVYDESGNFIDIWKDVVSELSFTHEINSIGSTTSIELARNSDTVGTVSSNLLTESNQNILAEDDLPLLAVTESKNQIGPGSSVDYNNRVDIYAFYGSTGPLQTEDYESIITEDDEEILADLGHPNGIRVFTGFISEINSRYGNTETTIVQLSSYGWDTDQFPLMKSGATTVTYNSYDPSDIAKDAIDQFVIDSSSYGTYTNRDSISIATSGTTVSYTFKSNTYKEVMDKVLELLPSNWYYRVGLGDNIVYYSSRSSTADHLFYLGKHIKALDLKGSILDVVNRVLFTGGGDPALYLDRSEAPADRTRRALKVMSDNRVTLTDSAEIIIDSNIDQNNKTQYRTTIEILSSVYDIESINVGQTIGFRNFGNYVDALTMQVVGLSYTPESVQLQLETKPPTINKRLEDIRRQLTVSENQDLPTTPS